jgi:transcriptional regulator with XRE-family HTH domain
MLESAEMDDVDTDLGAFFSARLLALRTERGWGKERAAQRVGCSFSYYCRLERGAQKPAFDLLPKLARGFGVDETDLFCFPQTADRHFIADALRVAPPAVRQRARELVEEMMPGRDTGRSGSVDTRPAARPRRAKDAS